eukprot:jgi/Ulvmu1/7407/UM036_0067.1
MAPTLVSFSCLDADRAVSRPLVARIGCGPRRRQTWLSLPHRCNASKSGPIGCSPHAGSVVQVNKSSTMAAQIVGAALALSCFGILAHMHQAVISWRDTRRTNQVVMWNVHTVEAGGSIGSPTSSHDASSADSPCADSPSSSPAHSIASHALSPRAISEAVLGMLRPTRSEQAAFRTGIDDLWIAAEVGYAMHVEQLLRQRRVPLDFRHPRRHSSLLMVAVGVRTRSVHYDRDLAAVLSTLLARGAAVAQVDAATGATPLHVLVAQPQLCVITARLRVLLQQIARAAPARVSALERVNAAGERPEDVAQGADTREQLRRLRQMIALDARHPRQ